MVAGDEHVGDDVLVLERRPPPAAPAPTLGPVLRQGRALDVARVGHGDDHLVVGDEILQGDLPGGLGDLGAALVAVGVAHGDQLPHDEVHQQPLIGQDRLQAPDLGGQLRILPLELLALQPGESLQAHVQDGLGLSRAQVVGAALSSHRELLLGHPGPAQKRLEPLELDGAQAAGGLLGVLGRSDGLDDQVDGLDGHAQPLHDLHAVARLAQLVLAAPHHHLAAVIDEVAQGLLEVDLPRLAPHDGDHVDAEARLQGGLLVELVLHHLVHGALFQGHHDAHAPAVGLIADVGHPLDGLVFHQLGDLLQQPRLVEQVGDLGDHQEPAAALGLLEVRAAPHHHRATPGLVGLVDAGAAVDDPPGGEVRRGDVLHQLADAQAGVADERHGGVDDLGEVVRRDVGGHPHGDARGAVDQQVRHPRGQHQGLELLLVVVGDEGDGLLLDVGQQVAAYPRHAHLGVAHGRRRVAVHRAEVALPVGEHVAHAKGLGHAHQRVVQGGVPVGVEPAHGIPHDARRLLVGLVPVVLQDVHRVQDPSMHRLEAVADVGERARGDYAHGVVQERAFHLLFDVDRDDGLVVRRRVFHGMIWGALQRPDPPRDEVTVAGFCLGRSASRKYPVCGR